MSVPAIKPTRGIVAFLDILGYQNFIENNNVEKAVEILMRAFDGLKDVVLQDIRQS